MMCRISGTTGKNKLCKNNSAPLPLIGKGAVFHTNSQQKCSILIEKAPPDGAAEYVFFGMENHIFSSVSFAPEKRMLPKRCVQFLYCFYSFGPFCEITNTSPEKPVLLRLAQLYHQRPIDEFGAARGRITGHGLHSGIGVQLLPGHDFCRVLQDVLEVR